MCPTGFELLVVLLPHLLSAEITNVSSCPVGVYIIMIGDVLWLFSCVLNSCILLLIFEGGAVFSSVQIRNRIPVLGLFRVRTSMRYI